MTQQTAEDLRAAARYIEQHGWCQGRFTDADGRVCAMGAIHRVMPDVSEDFQGRTDAKDALRQGIGQLIPYWNDADDRIASDVVKAFLQAADAVEFETP